ncbi:MULTISPECIES: translocation/assembly module TamB domain-containing protein [Polaromonas]|uniref:Translocation/assembly module TamB domain-containing protein n=1 Tax=Polaromonas aquatica TaxID=332657 RepID=A0ABW1TZS5_9BURK
MNALNTPGNKSPDQPGPRHAKPARRWLKAVVLAAAGLMAGITLALSALWWWAGSDGSLATALRWAGAWLAEPASSSAPPLATEGATGSLRSGGRIERLVWQRDGLTVEARDTSLAWQPWSLLSGTLQFERLAVASLQVDDQREPSAAPSAGPPDTLGLPLRIVLGAFSVGELRWLGSMHFSASGIAGRYEFNGRQHALDLGNAQVASGSYRGRATVAANNPLTLNASLSGTVASTLSGSKTPLALAFDATARGPLTELLLSATLRVAEQPAAGNTTMVATAVHASATARITPWAAQPLPQADASFRDVDIAALWPDAPQTLLTGSASVRPSGTASSTQSWSIQLQLANRLPGAWDQHRLPLERLEGLGEWRDGLAIVRSLKAQAGGGELLASGEWFGASTDKATPPWKLQATLRHISPQALHSQLAAPPLDGQASVQQQGAALGFQASLQTAGAPVAPAMASKGAPGTQLRLRDANASGSWNAGQAGGTLVLSSLRIRTDEAELSGQLEVQPTARGGKGSLALTAPGLDAKLQGELRQSSGKGDFSLQGKDAAQVLRWMQKLPGMPSAIQTALKTHSASGNAALTASWQGGWLDPMLKAQLDIPSFDWRANSSTTSTVATPTTPPEATPTVLKFRALQATLSGRLSQAQLSTQGRLEAGQRRYALQLNADAGRVPAAGRNRDAGWQGLIKQLSLSVEDAALGAGAWRLATRDTVNLKWIPANGSFESSAGEALLSAPATSAFTASNGPGAATLSWQPVRWQAGELTTAGKITGLPMAWIELVAGPQMAGAGLAGNLVFEGAWDARLGNTLALKVSLERSSGDITVQADGDPGGPARVTAGVRQARLSLASEGEAVTLVLRWDSERAGTVDGQLKTRLARTPANGSDKGSGTGGWLWPLDAPLSGQLRAQLPRIGVWSVLAPPGWRLRGSLGADITVSGTRAAPQLAGDLQANNLALRSVVDGIEFGKGRLRARLDGTRMRINEFTLQGAGDKGTGGSLTAQGEVAWLDGQPVLQLDAKLERLRASLRSDRQLTISGELQARHDKKQTQFSGALKVDQALILLPEEGTPQLGDDVVVRNGTGVAVGKKAPEQTSASTASAPQDSRTIKLAVKLDLGQDFRVQGKGVNTRVRGALALNGDSLTDPRLTGTVNTFGGEYRAYGQRLDIEQGLLRFTGPIDNPSLDVLAIRPNLTQRVGVQITGTALLPRVRLYAQPDLPDAEKLSWLVLGRSSASGGGEAALLQQAALALLGSKSGGMSGGLAASLGLDELSFRGASSNTDGSTTEGAVTLGKRFSRNFYAAYERSISGALGTLYIFYDLSQRFTVRAQAGQQSAVDLIFTIPYD